MKTKKEINVEIGGRIKTAREAAGLTQDRFAELVGMGSKNISAIERGMVGISLSSMQKICQVLSVSSDSLLFGYQVKNDAQALASRLGRLSPEQFHIVSNIVNNVLEAFALPGK